MKQFWGILLGLNAFTGNYYEYYLELSSNLVW